MLKIAVYIFGLTSLIVALSLAPMQGEPVLLTAGVLLLMLSFPALWYSRRINNAWPFLTIASLVLALLAAGEQGNAPPSFAHSHWFLKWFEVAFAALCAFGAAFEFIRRRRPKVRV